ncbi:CGNR zinc finger domain-containing protein [Sinosporangium siamense]|uniref:Zinc finger CGNR domain-containing protein n=1 Tax=Sinosporangium siamense TaxID=1367973 RepID=A0A919RDS5_9ACTN|nr:CGNR zinc finger domain-containing protein [Sinosporangium siamense]GII92023.1 hypothetical protein Ssi02_22540 [Sinosporangium siamense]
MEYVSETPAHVALILDFANTVDIEEGTDEFATAEGFTTWMADHGLPVPASRHGEGVDLRTGIRARVLITNGGEPPAGDLTTGQAVLDRLPLHVRLGERPEPGSPLPSADPLGRIAAAWALTVATGDWRRLKQCPDHDCGWVFWDATRSRTRRWCSMRVCGNRAKARNFAQARRDRPE